MPVQLNIVTCIDVNKALLQGSLDGAVFMMDNCAEDPDPQPRGEGTAELATFATQGQVLNWIVYSMSGPVMARISDIQFLDGEVCTRLKIYGAPDIGRSPPYRPGLTPVYDYWAGMVKPGLADGTYRYRLQFQLGDTFMCIETPAVVVRPDPSVKTVIGEAAA